MVRDPAQQQSGAMDNASPATESGNEPPTPPAGGPGPRVSREEMKDLGRLRRSVTDRHIGGVAGGLARHLDIDPLILRVTFVVAIFFGGAGLLAYIGAWALVPEEGTDDQPLGLDQRSRTVALAGVGVLALLCAVGDWAGAFWFPWPLAIVGAVACGSSTASSAVEPATRRTTPATPSPAMPSAPCPPTPCPPTTCRPTTRPRPTTPGAAPAPQPAQARPVLFFFTLALIALAEGALGVADLAGADFADSSYPALALGIITVMLLVGAFWGRAGGLIALGLVAAIATAGASLGNQFPEDEVTYAPDQCRPGRGELRHRRGRALPRPVRRRGRRRPRRPRHLDRRCRRSARGRRPGRHGRRRCGPRSRPATARSSTRAATASTSTSTGSATAGTAYPDMTINIDLFAGEIIVREAA